MRQIFERSPKSEAGEQFEELERSADSPDHRTTSEVHALHALVSLQSAALNAAANAIVITNLQGEILWVNTAFCLLTLYPVQEVLGKTPRILRSGSQDATFYRDLWATILAGKTWEGEIINKRKDGRLFVAGHTITPVRDGHNRVRHFIGIMHDVTDRRNAEAGLRETHLQLTTLFEHCPVIVYSLAAEGRRMRCTFVSENITRLLGYTIEEALTDGWWCSVLHQEDSASSLEGQKRLLEHGENRMQYRVRHRNGTYRWMEDTQRSITPRGQVEIFGVWRDITEERQLAENRRENEALIAALFRGSPHPFAYSTLEEGRFLEANDALLQFFGYERHEMIGRTAKELQLWPDPTARDRIINRLRAGEPVRNYETRFHCNGGNYRDALLSFNLVNTTGGPVILATIIDITGRKIMEEERRRTQRLESLGRLATGIAHDLNNILAPIMMAGPLLQGDMTASVRNEILATVEKSVHRGASLVRQLLDFGRGSEGTFERLNIADVIGEVADISRSTFPRTVEVKVHVANDLKSVHGDSTQLSQVLLNLSVNARDAMPNGGTLVIAAMNTRLSLEDVCSHPGVNEGRFVRIDVSDTGAGIAPNVAEHIFEPFFTTKEARNGTGLGLSIALSAVKNHGGYIGLNSELGRGSTFSIFIPAEEDTTASGASPVTTGRYRGKAQTILIIEDEEAVRAMLRETLLRNNYRVISAQNGMEGVALFIRHLGDVSAVLTDLDMPHMDGKSVIRRVRELSPTIPTLIVTGLGRGLELGERNEQLHAMGVNKVILKPFTAASILTALQEVFI